MTFFQFADWCKYKHKVDVVDSLMDHMETDNDSYNSVCLDDLECSDDDCLEKVAEILRNDFGIRDEIVFWVCW